MTWGPVIFNTLDPKGWVLISLTHRNLCQVWCTGSEHLWLFYRRLKTGVLSLFWLFIAHSLGCCTCMWVSDKPLIYYFMYDENIVAVWNMSHWVSFTVFPANFGVFGSVSVSSWGGNTCVCLSVTFASILSSPFLHYCTPSHFELLSATPVPTAHRHLRQSKARWLEMASNGDRDLDLSKRMLSLKSSELK